MTDDDKYWDSIFEPANQDVDLSPAQESTEDPWDSIFTPEALASTAPEPLNEAAPSVEPITAPDDPEERGFWSTIGDQFSSGARNMESGVLGTAFISGAIDEDTVADSFLNTIKKRRPAPEELQQLVEKAKKEGQEVIDAEGFWDTAVEAVDLVGEVFLEAVVNPKGTAYGIAESAANSLPSIALMATGALAGTATGNPAAIVAGGVTGSAVGTYAVEAGAHLQGLVVDKLTEQGRPAQDVKKQDILDVLRSEEFIDWAKSESVKRGIAVAAVEAVFTKVTGNITKGIIGSSLKDKAKKFGAATASETVGEMAGELGGQLATEGDVDPGDVVLEGVLGTGQSVATAGAGVMFDAMRNAISEKPSGGETNDPDSPIVAPLPDEGDIALDAVPQEFRPQEQPAPELAPQEIEGVDVVPAIDTAPVTPTQEVVQEAPPLVPVVAEPEDALTQTLKPVPGQDSLTTSLTDTSVIDALSESLVAEQGQRMDALVGALKSGFEGGEVQANIPTSATSTLIPSESIDQIFTPEALETLTATASVPETSSTSLEEVFTPKALKAVTATVPSTPPSSVGVSESPGESIVPSNVGTSVSTSVKPEDAVEVAEISAKANEANTSPTEAQIESGNYKKGKIEVQGIPIAVENPKGSTRTGVDPNGEPWASTMTSHYGEISRSKGADGDPVDVFVGEAPKSTKVFVVDQVDAQGKFDESKVMLGFNTRKEALDNYKSNYTKGWKVGPVTEFTQSQLKGWLANGDTTKGAAEFTKGSSKSSTPLNEIKLEREATRADGKVVKMRQRADVAVKNVDKKRDIAKRLLRCVNG